MTIKELKGLSHLIKQVVVWELQPLFIAIKSDCPEFKGFGDIIDTAVYRKGSMRLYGQCKEDSK